MKIKGTDKNMQCKGFQFEIGKTYDTGATGITEKDLCSNKVFHYCDNPVDVHSFYPVDSDNRFFEIEVLGEEVTDKFKFGSNRIRFVREIRGDELDVLTGRKRGNTGLFNTGASNSGKLNTGFFNTGDFNTGDYNSGDFNSGSHNSGGCNTGSHNSGDSNAGDFDTGDFNTGDFNTGDYNSGYFNACSRSSGAFCTKPEKIRLFNKPSDLTFREFVNSKYMGAIYSSCFPLNELIDGKLVTRSYKEACAIWWENMTDENKEIIKSIPNFDAEIFEDITGIDVQEEEI